MISSYCLSCLGWLTHNAVHVSFWLPPRPVHYANPDGYLAGTDRGLHDNRKMQMSCAESFEPEMSTAKPLPHVCFFFFLINVSLTQLRSDETGSACNRNQTQEIKQEQGRKYTRLQSLRPKVCEHTPIPNSTNIQHARV